MVSGVPTLAEYIHCPMGMLFNTLYPPNTGPHTSSELSGEGLGGEANLTFLFRFTSQNFIYFQYLVPTVRVPINGERPEGKENREGGERGWIRIYLYWKCINIHSVKGNTFN